MLQQEDRLKELSKDILYVKLFKCLTSKENVFQQDY